MSHTWKVTLCDIPHMFCYNRIEVPYFQQKNSCFQFQNIYVLLKYKDEKVITLNMWQEFSIAVFRHRVLDKTSTLDYCYKHIVSSSVTTLVQI